MDFFIVIGILVILGVTVAIRVVKSKAVQKTVTGTKPSLGGSDLESRRKPEEIGTNG
jgi:hypothetical protein